MAMDDTPPFHNLIRFLDETSSEHYGSISEQSTETIVGSTVRVLDGDLYSLRATNRTAVVVRLLSPIPHTPLFICVGLNYANHVKEANLPIPPNPVIFYKPPDALAGPSDNIIIPQQVAMLDYEGELCVIIKRDGKDISETEAADYIFGYTAGNDFSSRYWQREPRSGGQFGFAKSFDGFAPLGPTILSPRVADASSFQITTRVNGTVRQNAPTSDMIFNVRQIIAHISQGTTLRKGTVIMTGTPSGIAAKMPGEPWLQSSDVIEVEIAGIGVLRNTVVQE